MTMVWVMRWQVKLAPIAVAETFVPQHGHTGFTDEQDDPGVPKITKTNRYLRMHLPQARLRWLASSRKKTLPTRPGLLVFCEVHLTKEIHRSSIIRLRQAVLRESSETQSPSNDTTTSQSAVDTGLVNTSGRSLPQDEISKVIQPNALVSSALDHLEPSIGTVTDALGSELSTVVSGTANEISHVIQPNTLFSSALDHLEPSIGTVTGALGSELSTVISGAANEISHVIQPTTLVSSAHDHLEPSMAP